VVIDDLDLFGVAVSPNEADTPLIVDPDTVLAGTVSAQRFQAVARKQGQVFQTARGSQLIQFPACNPLYVYEPRDTLAAGKARRRA
jgi:hypothetical protein